jgi:hypothetical protein
MSKFDEFDFSKIDTNEVILLTFSTGKVSLDQARHLAQLIIKEYPSAKLILLPEDISLKNISKSALSQLKDSIDELLIT